MGRAGNACCNSSDTKKDKEVPFDKDTPGDIESKIESKMNKDMKVPAMRIQNEFF